MNFTRSCAQLLLLLFCCFAVRAADTLHVSINLNNLANNTLHVRIQAPGVHFNPQRFFFPTNFPGAITEVLSGKLVSNFSAIADDGSPMKLEQNGTNEFRITGTQHMARVEYDIHDSWHYSDPTLVLPQLGTDFRAQHFLLNFFVMLGYFEGFEKNPISLSIIHAPQLKLCGGLKEQDSSNDTLDIFFARNYMELVDHPLMYSLNAPYRFQVGTTWFNVALHSERDSVTMGEVVKVLKPVCEGVYNFCNGLSAREFSFLMNFSNPRTDRVPSDETYGAVQHSNSSVFFLPEASDKFKVQRDVQMVASHELFHVFEPLNFKTDATSKLNLRAKTESSNLWFYEGVTEYFSLLMQLRYDLITQQEFITEIRNKLTLLGFYEPFSLTDQSERCHLPGNAGLYRNFYYKGAVTAMMMDLKLLELSKGGMNLQDLIIRMKRNAKDGYVIKDEEVIPEMVRLSFPEMQAFFADYVKGTKTTDYNQFLNTIGWAYEPHRTDTTLLYANAMYRYNKTTGEIYMTNISINQAGFRQGDVLLKINGKKVTKDNVDDLLATVTSIWNDEPATFTIRRNGKEMDLTAKPLTISKEQQNLIEAQKKTTKEQRSMQQRFKQGNLNKSKPYRMLN